MPPPDEGPLDETQKRIVRQWLAGGAKVARLPEPPLDESAPPSRVTAEDRSHWSFRTPSRFPVPAPTASPRIRTPVDAWIYDGLAPQTLDFNPDADRRQLLRRLPFYPWGVPPAWDACEAFRCDAGPAAFSRLGDRAVRCTFLVCRRVVGTACSRLGALIRGACPEAASGQQHDSASTGPTHSACRLRRSR